MNTNLTHPTAEQLAAFGQGRLPLADQAVLEEHIAGCDACCQVLRGVGDDTLVGRLREAGTPLELPRPESIANRRAQATEVPAALVDHPRYRIIRQLGAGGMGVVYQAEHRLMERPVALKVVHPTLLRHPTAVERFRNEVKAAARLTHPNIVTAHDADQAGEMHFLVMEFVDGVSLSQFVERHGRLTVKRACNYIHQAAVGLQHAFERGMVHRDIKPQNLMLSREGQVKILDFGLARFAQEVSVADTASPSSRGDTLGLTSAGAVIGTPDYIAPEQVHNSRTADIRADIYSLGCTLYYLLTGRVPFPQGSITQKLESHIDGDAPPLEALRDDVPSEVTRIVARMMAKEPAQRYQTPGEVAQALLPFARSDSNRSESRAPTLPPVWVSVNTVKPASITGVGKSRASHGRRNLLIGATVVALLGVGAWIYSWNGAATPANSTTPPTKALAASTKPAPANPAPATVPAATVPQLPAPKKILIVMPNQSVWYPDYAPVRRELEAAGGKVRVASTKLSAVRTTGMSDVATVKPDIPVSQAKASDYDAVIFVGGEFQEFVGDGEGADDARRLIAEQLSRKKPLAAICLGQTALLDAGVLDDQRVANSPYSRQHFGDKNIQWVDQPVVKSGSIITAGRPEDAVLFAQAILRMLTSGP